MEQPTSSAATGTTCVSHEDAKLHEQIPRQSQESGRSDSPSVMSSCLSEAVAERDENASFCDPFSDDEEDTHAPLGRRPSQSLRRATSSSGAIGTAISVDSVLARNSTGAFAAIRPHTSAIDGAASATNINTSSLAQSIGLGTRICGLVSIADASSLSESAASAVVQRRGYAARDALTHTRNPKHNSSQFQVTKPQKRQHHLRQSGSDGSGGRGGGGCRCCNYTGVRTSHVGGGGESYDYDCICQHSCSSSISSLGSPDLDNLDDDDSICCNPSATGTRKDLNATEAATGRSDDRPEDFHRQLMTVFENHRQNDEGSTNVRGGNKVTRCGDNDECAGYDASDDGDDDDTLPTIEMQHVKMSDEIQPTRTHPLAAFEAAVKHYQPTRSATGNTCNPSGFLRNPRNSIPSVVQVQLPAPLATRPTLSDLSRAAGAICSSYDHNDPSTHLSKLTAMSTRQMVQRAAEHRTKIMVALKTPKRPDRLTTSFMPDEVVTRATSFLDVQSLLQLRVTCRVMRDLASRDEAGWYEACRRLWTTKVNICREALDMFESNGVRQMRKKRRRKLNKSPVRSSSSSRSGSVARRSYGAMGAYRVSSIDAKERDAITMEELCYDGSMSAPSPSSSGRNSATVSRKRLFDDETSQQEHGEDHKIKPHSGHSFHGPVFSFRFKEAAGADWTSWDPWWNEKEARAMVFLKDGTVKQIIPRSALQQPSDDTCMVADEDDRIREEDRSNGYVLCSPFSDGLDVTESSNRMAEGIHDNRRPKIEIRWRFVSDPIDMPSRPEGAYIRLTVGNRDVPTYVVRRSPTGNWGFCLESCWGLFASFELPLKENTQQKNNTDGDVYVALLQDSALSVTSSVQWREAMLYNYGAVTLPEGRVAAAHYRRLWGEN